MEVAGRHCLVNSLLVSTSDPERAREAVVAEIKLLAHATRATPGVGFPERLVNAGRLHHEGVWLRTWRDAYGVLPNNLRGAHQPLPQAVAVPPPSPRFQSLRSLWCFSPDKPPAPPVPSAAVREAFRSQWRGDTEATPNRAVGRAVKRAVREAFVL